jgi:hypothetical protein
VHCDRILEVCSCFFVIFLGLEEQPSLSCNCSQDDCHEIVLIFKHSFVQFVPSWVPKRIVQLCVQCLIFHANECRTGRSLLRITRVTSMNRAVFNMASVRRFDAVFTSAPFNAKILCLQDIQNLLNYFFKSRSNRRHVNFGSKEELKFSNLIYSIHI